MRVIMQFTPEMPTETRKPTPVIEKVYDYCNETGVLLYQNVRFKPKDFRQRKPGDNGEWDWNLKGVRRVLYRLKELLQSEPSDIIFYVERRIVIIFGPWG